MKRIAILTEEKHPQLTDDDRWLLPAFAARGVVAKPLIWTLDDFEDFDAILVRSPWDYYQRADEFNAWMSRRESHGTRFVNELSLLRWNFHKKYLLELAARGHAVIDTLLLKQGEVAAGLASVLETAKAKAWSRVVVKPAISANAFETRRLNWPPTGEDEAWMRSLAETTDLLMQPYVSEIEERGELSLVAINGQLSHAYLKRPKTGEFRVQEQFGGVNERVDLQPAHQELATQLLVEAKELSGSKEIAAYARIDLIPCGAVEWQLGELELFEPALQFRFEPKAATALADAVISLTEWNE